MNRYSVTISFCLAIFYLSEIRSPVSTIPCSISLPTSTLYSFHDITFSWTIHVLASDVNVISPRGPRVYLSVIRMDKSHSWSTSLNWHFPSTRRHLYNHPIMVWRLMESKCSSCQWLTWSHGLRNKATSYDKIQQQNRWYDRIVISIVGECSSHHSPMIWPCYQQHPMLMIRKPWSSVDQQASI